MMFVVLQSVSMLIVIRHSDVILSVSFLNVVVPVFQVASEDEAPTRRFRLEKIERRTDQEGLHRGRGRHGDTKVPH
jgi:hypothetical protein